jgi:hypothetical protein
MTTTVAPALPSGQPSIYSAAIPGSIYAGIGEGSGMQVTADSPALPKLCAAGWSGTGSEGQGENASPVQLYETLYVAPAQPSPRAIDVFIDDRLWHTVRW